MAAVSEERQGLNMRASRGMGDINPSKMPKGKRLARRDDTDFEQFAKGGKVKRFNGSEGSEVKNKMIVREGKDIPTYKGQMYWEEPSFLEKRLIDAKEIAGDVGRAAGKLLDRHGLMLKQEERNMQSEKKAKGGWIKNAIKKPGALRKELGVKEGKTIPAKKLAAAAKKPGKLGQRARLAKTLKGLKK